MRHATISRLLFQTLNGIVKVAKRDKWLRVINWEKSVDKHSLDVECILINAAWGTKNNASRAAVIDISPSASASALKAWRTGPVVGSWQEALVM